MKTEKYWLEAARDMEKFRNGQILRDELIAKYPELRIREDGCGNNCPVEERKNHHCGIRCVEEGIVFKIPKECPLDCAVEIAFSAKNRCEDNFSVKLRGFELPFCPEWKQLKQIGRLRSICECELSIDFRCSVKDDIIELRECIQHGDRGDEDGYGMEDDLWLIGKLNRQGKWVVPFYIGY